jgi:hypothetical protein
MVKRDYARGKPGEKGVAGQLRRPNPAVCSRVPIYRKPGEKALPETGSTDAKEDYQTAGVSTQCTVISR